ncbi:MAG: hypothetical protein PF518_03840 [Spirochaetaceae bacterium]|jgi:hypothetical protein|nr:hypothetical protein [Spirochaetaceae bacterium]
MRRNVIFVLIAILFLVVVSPASSQNFEFVSFVDYYGGIEPSVGYENLRSRVFMRPTFFGTEKNTGLEWHLSANLWAQPLGEPGNIDPWDILYETYLFLPFTYFDITVGQKIVTYGFADIFGPLNALHSTNRTPFSLDDSFDSRRPDPLIQIRFYPTYEDTIELTYVPITRPDRERPGPITLPDSQDTVEWSNKPYITDSLHSFYVNYNRYGEKVDLQFFYGWYTEQTPDFLVSETSSSVVSVITPVYRKKHTFGFAYSTGIWNAILSQDFAFNLTCDFSGEDIGAQNSDITINTQLLVNLPWNILSQYSLIYSFFFNYDKHDPGSDPVASSYLAKEIQSFHTQPLQNIAFIIAHFEKSFLREKLKTTLNVGFFFSPEIYFGPRVAYSLNDYWQMETGADITLGDPPDKDLRRNPSNDNYYVRLLYRY